MIYNTPIPPEEMHLWEQIVCPVCDNTHFHRKETSNLCIQCQTAASGSF